MTADQAKELKQLDCWKALCKEIDKIVVYESEKLLSCSAEELLKIQERVRAVQELVRLPQNIIDREEE